MGNIIHNNCSGVYILRRTHKYVIVLYRDDETGLLTVHKFNIDG